MERTKSARHMPYFANLTIFILITMYVRTRNLNLVLSVFVSISLFYQRPPMVHCTLLFAGDDDWHLPLRL